MEFIENSEAKEAEDDGAQTSSSSAAAGVATNSAEEGNFLPKAGPQRFGK
jgi:hypothetical protein